MTQRTTVFGIIAAAWALSGCGVSSPDRNSAVAISGAPHLLVELQALPHGHPPVPGYSSPMTLPEGHPPVHGHHPSPALPEGHPRCPARGSLGTPPSDAGLNLGLLSPPEVVST